MVENHHITNSPHLTYIQRDTYFLEPGLAIWPIPFTQALGLFVKYTEHFLNVVPTQTEHTIILVNSHIGYLG